MKVKYIAFGALVATLWVGGCYIRKAGEAELARVQAADTSQDFSRLSTRDLLAEEVAYDARKEAEYRASQAPTCTKEDIERWRKIFETRGITNSL